MQPFEALPWDSAFFGVRIARVRMENATPSQLSQAVLEADRTGIACLYWLIDSADVHSSTAAERCGFRLIDIRVTLEHSLDSDAGPRPPHEFVRAMTAKDLPALAALARSSHRDSRFFCDGNFAAERCEALYEEWLRKSLAEGSGKALVAEKDGNPAGYCTCDLREGGIGSIGLIAVDPRWRRASLGKALVETALTFFRSSGMRSATVVTQGRNIASQRLYQRSGFVTKSMQLWYHRWPSDAGTSSQ